MPSSLAAQLARSVSLNAPLLAESTRKKHVASSSYLFASSAATANLQLEDLDSIHALATNALAQLKQLHPAFVAFDDDSRVYQQVFSHRAKETDRTLLGREEVQALDDALRTILRCLGPCLMESVAGKVLEWLVRRFRCVLFQLTTNR